MSATSLTQTPLQSTANKPTIDTAILTSVWHTELQQHHLKSLVRADEAEEWGQDLEERIQKQREQENGEGGRVTGGLYLDKNTHNEKKSMREHQSAFRSTLQAACINTLGLKQRH